MDCKFNTELGLVTVSDEVLVRVAGYAALDCYGIVGMASKRSTDGIVQLMGRENLGRGVKIRTSGDKVDIDLFIIVEYGISISAVAAAIIQTVKYKVEHLPGIPVGRVNVCVEDIRVCARRDRGTIARGGESPLRPAVDSAFPRRPVHGRRGPQENPAHEFRIGGDIGRKS